MSRAQWGHGYWRGYTDAMLRRPRVIGFLSVWHWPLRHCWWLAVTHPVSYDPTARPAWVSVTVFGCTWFLSG